MSENVFRNAIVRLPGQNFEDGLTSGDSGRPAYAKALKQHATYCSALKHCGLHVVALEADLQHPDSTFVEDTAVLTSRAALAPFSPSFRQIEAPGALDGGDVCEAAGHFFIGLSHRTNEEGARQLTEFLAADGFSSSLVDTRGIKGTLHLKSGLAWVGGNFLVLWDSLADLPDFRAYDLMRILPEENYAANCVRANSRVLLPSGCPRLESRLKIRGFNTLALDMSEFEKMDGGLSCLSLRF